MALFKRDGDRLRVKQLRAINHPLRRRLMEIHLRESRRSSSVEVLVAALEKTREFSGVKAAEVKYHLTRLQDAAIEANVNVTGIALVAGVPLLLCEPEVMPRVRRLAAKFTREKGGSPGRRDSAFSSAAIVVIALGGTS